MGKAQDRIKRLERRVGLYQLGFTAIGGYLGPDLDADQWATNELAVRLWHLCLRLMAEGEKKDRRIEKLDEACERMENLVDQLHAQRDENGRAFEAAGLKWPREY